MSLTSNSTPVVITGARLATMDPAYSAVGDVGSLAVNGDNAVQQSAALVIGGGRILWLGPERQLPDAYRQYRSQDVEGRLVTPALIDCHTHLVHGGNRAREFALHLEGASYEEIARSGGGILSTVQTTREASDPQLLDSALQRVDALISEGVSRIEIKSGYGLDNETELRMLRIAREIGSRRPVRISTSFLGAHTLPPEYKGRADEYLKEVCIPTFRQAVEEGLVDALDGFCETIAFSPDQLRPLFECAQQLDVPVKLHTEQLSSMGGCVLATSHGALSLDHLEYLNAEGARAMADAGSVAVLLPGAFYCLQQDQPPPVELLRQHKVPLAVATDCNPGSSPLCSLLTAMNMACVLFGLTPAEALAGVTRNAAQALGLQDEGVLRPGARADLAIWNLQEPAELAYGIGYRPLHKMVFNGVL